MGLSAFVPARIRVGLYGLRRDLGGIGSALTAPRQPLSRSLYSAEELAAFSETARRERAERLAAALAAGEQEDLRAVFRDLKVVRVVRQTDRAVTLVFDNRVDPPIRFRPGQYMKLILTIDGEEHRRAYSFCSDPAESDRVSVTVKQAGEGVVSKHIVAAVKPGDRIRTLGPNGLFGIEPDPGAVRRIVLIAAGSGVTPIMSLARSLTAREPKSEVELVYGNRRWKDVIFRDELEQLARERPQLTVRHVLTRPPENWPGPRGRLAGDVLAATVPVDHEALYFICGPGPMMDGVMRHLRRQGVPRKHIQVERFLAQAGTRRRAATGDTHSVRFVRSGVLLQVPDSQTILEAGLAAGIPLRFSCRMGGCGTCRTRLSSGGADGVDMEEPNCLTDEERRAGDRLLCVSQPRSPLTVDA